MIKTKLIVIGVLSYVAFLLVLMPLSWWIKLAPLPAQMQLGAVSGTLWQGEVATLRYQQLQLDSLQWKLNGWQLFTGALQFDLRSGSAQHPERPFIKSTARIGVGGSSLHNTLVTVPVSAIVPMLTLPMPIAARGQLVLDIASYHQGKPWCQQLSGNASWQQAQLQTPAANWLDLQSLFAELSCADGTVVLTTDGTNLLGLDITAVINAEQLLVNGTLKPDASMPQEVHQAMQFLGRPDEQGRYRIRF